MKNKNIVLTDWDKDLFSYLHAQKCATLNQIERDLSYNKNRRTLNWRIWKLVHCGYLVNLMSIDRNRAKVVAISKRCFKLFIDGDLKVRKELKSDAISHDLDLIDIRSKLFNSKKVKNYHTENTLQTWKEEYDDSKIKPFIKLNTDAVMEVKIFKGYFYIGIEYESSRKGKSRYEDLMKSYYRNKEIDAVFYICKDEKLQSYMQKCEQKFKPEKDEFKFYYCTYENLINNDQIKFTTIDDATLEL